MALTAAERQKRYRERKKKQEYQYLNICISKKAYQKLKIFRQNETISFSDTINMIVCYFLQNDLSEQNLKKMEELADKLEKKTASEIRNWKKEERRKFIEKLRKKWQKK